MSHPSQKADNSPLIVAEFYGYNPFALGSEDNQDPPIATQSIDGTSSIVLHPKTLMVRFRMSENQVSGDRGIIKKAEIENILYLPFDTWSVGGICKVITLEYPATGTRDERRRIAMKSLRMDDKGNVLERHEVYGISRDRYDNHGITTECVQRHKVDNGSNFVIEVPEMIKSVLRVRDAAQLAAA